MRILVQELGCRVELDHGKKFVQLLFDALAARADSVQPEHPGELIADGVDRVQGRERILQEELDFPT